MTIPSQPSLLHSERGDMILLSLLSYLEIISFAVKNIKKYFVDIVVTRGRNNKTYVELPGILNWCIKRDMIQQALTLAEDKTASYLEEKEVIKFPEIKLDFVKKVSDIILGKTGINIYVIIINICLKVSGLI